MQSILNFFKSRYFWIGFGFAVLVVLTLVLGAWLDWSLVTRLLIVIGLLVICIGIVVYELVRASRSAQQIEQSIKMQAEQQRMSSRPDKQSEIKELQERLEDAIATLKQSKLGRGRRSSAALHALPWYMFIGPPGAGKTTAIQNSGLNFPVGTDSVRGVGGTRNCDWFFTDQAILLDTAGRYMTEHEDEEEWHAFLDMLKEHRTDRPINGVLVGISMDELLDASPDEIEWHANNIRRRVSELVERLGVRFPVYLVFTKCDLLQGFVEFFGDMTRQEREQIWGCTFTEEQREDGSPRPLFEEEFDRLHNVLMDVRAERLSRSMKREDRRKVYTFPLQFASAKENLSLFVDQLFQQNPYQENPEFRGFYFTSGTQEGAPIDHVIQSVSDQFDFASGIEGGTEPEKETKSYFLNDLFTDVVIPDQYLVEQTSSAARRGRLLRWGIGAAAAVVLVLFVVGLSQALVRSRLTLNEVENTAQAASVVQWDGQNLTEDLERMNRLREQVSKLEQYEQNPPLLQWGFHRGGTVLDPARSLYYTKMRPLVRTQFEALGQRLSDAQAPSEQERSVLRDQLENYLLLSDSSHALDQTRYRDQLVQSLTDRMTRASSPTATVSFQGLGGQIQRHVNAYVEGLRAGHVEPFEAQSFLVERVTRMVNRPPGIDQLYTQIKERGSSQLAPVTLSKILSESRGSLSLFANPSQVRVSGFFTKRGWNNFVQQQIKEEAAAPNQTGLIGDGSQQLPENLRDPEAVEKQLRERYFGEYVTAWRQFLGSIRYRPFGGLPSTAQNLQTLGAQYSSPLLHILGRVTNETRFESLVDVGAAKSQLQDEAQRRAEGAVQRRTGVQGDVPASSEETASAHPVNSRMRGLHRLNADRAPSGGASSDLTQALGVLRKVGRILDGMRNDRSQVADFAKRVLGDGGGLLDQQMRSLRDYLSQLSPQARRELFEQPILDGWAAVLTQTQTYLNERWDETVYGAYQANLQGRYPISESSQDASLQAFQSFFNPRKGTLASFYENHLAPFLQEGRSGVRTWEGRGLQVSSATLQALNKADQIRDELFSGGFGIQFALTPDQTQRNGDAPAPGRVTLRVHGMEQIYAQGLPQEQTFRWPGPSRGAQLQITTEDGIVGPKQFDGIWAWFRLLENAEVDPQSTTTYRVRWRFQPSEGSSLVAIYDLYSEDATNVFANPGEFLRYRVPATID